MSWLVLVVPSTFAEVIGLSLKTSGANSYFNNQLFTGFVYLAAFIFGMFESGSLVYFEARSALGQDVDLHETGWFLRAWKIQELEDAHRK